MIHELLPQCAASADAFEDCGEGELYPEESVLIQDAVPKRRREFATVRACARRALAGLGHPAGPVLPGPRNAPRWPAGTVGSMTHCDGYRAAAVARASDIRALGIDAEPNLPMPDGVLASIALPQEEAWAGGSSSPGLVQRGRLLFSAKESVYKAWYPMMATELGFSDALLRFRGLPARSDTSARQASGTFSATLTQDPATGRDRAVTGFEGRWLVRAGIILTAVTLPARS